MLGSALAVGALGALLSACSDEESGGGGAGGTGGSAGPSCVDELVLAQPFDIDPAGTGTQIHADVLFDGEGLWVAYNQPNDQGNFDVYLTRLGCNGGALLAPVRVNTTLSGNHVDPDVIQVEGGLVVAWSSDNQTGVNNMDVLYRTFDAEGSPTMAADATLETTYQDNPVAGNVMQPTLAVLPAGAFAIAAVRGLDTVSSFQVFVQRMTAAGALAGAAIDVVIENDITHGYPTLTGTSGGDLYLAYAAAPLTGDVSLVQSLLAAGSATFAPLPPVTVASSANGSVGSYASDTTGRVLLAYDLANDIVLRDGAIGATGGRSLSVATDGGTDYAPTLTLAPGGGAVFWYRNQGGFSNLFQAQRFDDDGATLTAGPLQSVASPVPPYAPAATHVAGHVYFAAWSEGTSPDFVLRGMFVDLGS